MRKPLRPQSKKQKERRMTDLRTVRSGGGYRFHCTSWKNAWDGDTIYLTVDRGQRIYTKDKYRLDGIDAPEIRGADEEERYGREAKAFLLDIIDTNAHTLLVETVKKGKFDYNAILWAAYLETGNALSPLKTEDGYLYYCVNDYLIQRGHAVEYFDGTKTPWEERKRLQDEARAEWLKSETTD